MTILVAVLAAIWGLLLLQFLLNLLMVPRVPLPASSRSSGPFVSVIVPARNEELSIGATLRALGQQTYLDYEVIAVDDCSEDDTGRIAQAVAEEYPTVTVIDGKPPPEGWLGKPHAMLQAFEHAKGEILLFTDADILHDAKSLEATVAYLEDEGLDLITAAPTVIGGDPSEDVLLGACLGAVPLLPLWAHNVEAFRWSGSAAGAFILVRREALMEAGGIERIRRAYIDDVSLGHNVKAAGGRTRVVTGTHLLRFRPFPDLAGMFVAVEKNFFALFFNSWLLALFFGALPLLFVFVLPFVLLPYLAWAAAAGSTSTTTLLVADGAIVATILAFRSWPCFVFPKFRWWCIPTAPMGFLLVVYCMWRAASRTWQRGATRWRGRDYEPGGPFG